MDQYREPDKSLGLIGACEKNVVVFAEMMLGIKLYAWQVNFLNKVQEAIKNGKESDINKEFLALTSRQIGKSTALAITCIWSAVFNKYPATISNNTSVLVVSASDVQAKKLLNEMKKFMRIGDGFIKSKYKDEEGKPVFGESFFSDLLDDHEANNTTTITFKAYDEAVHGEYLLKGSVSGSVIRSYPPTSAVLGETASVVIVDEAGKTDKISDEFFWEYLYPTGNSTNAIRIYTSTPWVSSGFFYRMVDPDDMYGGTPADIVVFSIDAIKDENPKYYKTVKKIVDQLNTDGKVDEVQRAYYCRFVKGEQAYFNPKKVREAFTDEYEQIEVYQGMCDMGVDFGGQTTSRTVITITEFTDDEKVRRLYRRIYNVGEDNNLIDDIAELKQRFNIQRIIPDDCPQGDYLIREMIERGWEVHPMNFRSEKTAKYGAFRSALNRGDIISFRDDALQTEMLALEFSEGKRNTVIQHAPGYSDDMIDSFLLSAYFFVQEDGNFKIYSWDEDDE
jgi:hypothetical protein